jgi:hypothetical protein
MVWFFDRGGQTIIIKTRLDRQTNEFIVSITRPNPSETLTERYIAIDAFTERLAALQREFDLGSWRQRGGPSLIPAEWWGPQTT